MSEAHAHAPMAMHHDHGWLVVSDASDGVYIKIAKGLGTEKEQSLARLIAAAPDLLDVVYQAISLIENCSIESGVCMCGDSMDRHSDLMESGHSPVDSGGHFADLVLKRARAAIAKATGGAAC